MFKPALFALALLMPATARAADARCVWALLPAADQARLTQSYAFPEKALGQLDAKSVMAKIGTCIAPPEAAARPLFTWRLGALIAGYAKQLGAARDLAARGIEEQALEDAWANLGASSRAKLINAMPVQPGLAAPADREQIRVLTLSAAQLAGWSPLVADDSPAPFVQYFLGRAVRTRLEAALGS